MFPEVSNLRRKMKVGVRKGPFFPQVVEVFIVIKENLNYIENIKIEITHHVETQREVLCSLVFVFFWFCIVMF